MSYKGRVTFRTVGYHPLLEATHDALVRRGFVSLQDEPTDLVIVGLLAPKLREPGTKYLVLSDDCVYMDRNLELEVLDKIPSKEDMPILIPGVAASITPLMCEVIAMEHFYLQSGNALIARLSGVFGPNVPGTLVSSIVTSVKTKTDIALYSPGYQTRTYLHEEDAVELLCLLTERLIQGTTGTFNVSGTTEMSAKRLADTLWQLEHGVEEETPIQRKPVDRYYRWWVLPDMAKTLAVTAYKFPQSLRSRLRSML